MCIFSKSDTYCQRLRLNPGGEHLLSGRRGRPSKPLLKGSLNQLRGQAAQLKTVTNYAFLFYLKYLAADKTQNGDNPCDHSDDALLFIEDAKDYLPVLSFNNGGCLLTGNANISKCQKRL